MTLPWRRLHPREDGLNPGVAQRVRGYNAGDKIDVTTEPRVRMDIVTAVQIASLSDQPLGLVELLCDTAPAEVLPAHEMPVMATPALDGAISGAVSMGRRYRDKLNTKIRQAREAYRLDADIARSSAFVARMVRDIKIARLMMWACGGTAGALLVTLAVWLIWEV